jgi:hypothetical protein
MKIVAVESVRGRSGARRVAEGSEFRDLSPAGTSARREIEKGATRVPSECRPFACATVREDMADEGGGERSIALDTGGRGAHYARGAAA